MAKKLVVFGGLEHGRDAQRAEAGRKLKVGAVRYRGFAWEDSITVVL